MPSCIYTLRDRLAPTLVEATLVWITPRLCHFANVR
jgi:hypothetical protein